MTKHLNHYIYDKEAAKRAINFFETQLTLDGERMGEPFIPRSYQREALERLYGEKHRDSGYRRYRKYSLWIPKKNGKSPFAAAIGLYNFIGDGETKGGRNICCAASEIDQSDITYGYVKGMIERNPSMASRVRLYANGTMLYKDNTLRKLSGRKKGKHGFIWQTVLNDELHEFQGRELYESLLFGLAGRTQPMQIITSTIGDNLDEIWYEEYEYALAVQKGEINDPTYLAQVFKADKDDNPHLKRTWKKANPFLDIGVKSAFLEGESNKCKHQPRLLPAFKRYHLNIITGGADAWIDTEIWDACDFGEVSLESLKYDDCFVSFDLANKKDLIAVGAFWPATDEREKHVLRVWHWCPEETIAMQETVKEALYLQWKETGHITSVPGATHDHREVRDLIDWMKDNLNVLDFSCDGWLSWPILKDLQDEGLEIAEVAQNFKGMSPGTKELEAMILSKNINNQGNPLLSWECRNVRILEDNHDNVKPIKKRRDAKIDGIVCAIMCIGRWMKYLEDDTYATADDIIFVQS